MKTWMIAIALVAMLGMTGFANAKGNGKAHGKGGIHGKIESVTADSMTLTVGGKKNPHSVTVKFDNTTPITIDGVAGKLDASLVGKHASVAGATSTTNGVESVTATQITVSTKHHHKKAA